MVQKSGIHQFEGTVTVVYPSYIMVFYIPGGEPDVWTINTISQLVRRPFPIFYNYIFHKDGWPRPLLGGSFPIYKPSTSANLEGGPNNPQVLGTYVTNHGC